MINFSHFPVQASIPQSVKFKACVCVDEGQRMNTGYARNWHMLASRDAREIHPLLFTVHWHINVFVIFPLTEQNVSTSTSHP